MASKTQNPSYQISMNRVRHLPSIREESPIRTPRSRNSKTPLSARSYLSTPASSISGYDVIQSSPVFLTEEDRYKDNIDLNDLISHYLPSSNNGDYRSVLNGDSTLPRGCPCCVERNAENIERRRQGGLPEDTRDIEYGAPQEPPGGTTSPNRPHNHSGDAVASTSKAEPPLKKSILKKVPNSSYSDPSYRGWSYYEPPPYASYRPRDYTRPSNIEYPRISTLNSDVPLLFGDVRSYDGAYNVHPTDPSIMNNVMDANSNFDKAMKKLQGFT